jgi:hypothetical protein
MSTVLTPLREPVLVFLHSPCALRVEFNLDNSSLHLWWSPGAGANHDALERDFSNRDVHLELFESILLPGCDLAHFVSCDYDPWHLALRFEQQVLHLAVQADRPALLLWTEAAQPLEIVTALADTVQTASARALQVSHRERGRTFLFDVRSPADFAFRHSPKPSPGHKVYSRGVLPPGQGLCLSVDETLSSVPTDLSDPPDLPRAMANTEAWLAPLEAAGRLLAPAHPVLEQLRRLNQRGLASMFDHSGAIRASIKSIYYLSWIRDAVFTAAGCTAAGWPHRLEELCQLLLSNPCHARGDGVPRGRMFAQLIHPDGGKYEEDGIFYVLWATFLHWSQTGDDRFVSGENLILLREAIDWVDRRCWDPGRGLYGGHFADETPAFGSRDHGWDHVTGKPLDGSDHIRIGTKPVTRSYDIYLNTLMHSTWSMLARMTADPAAQARADALWAMLKDLYQDRRNGLPAYGDLLLLEGGEERVYAWGPVSSVYVWALTLPNFLPLDDRDALLHILLARLAHEPQMHWTNGLCAAIAACDTWTCGEALPLSLLLRISDDAMKPGPWHPMAGAMPEKFEAPQGNLYHDIRPQAFAMGAWLGALASLGLRRLPRGLALRPTRAYEGIQNHQAFGHRFDLDFRPETSPVLRVNGIPCPHTLQVPENLLQAPCNHLSLGGKPEVRPLLLRSNAKLLEVLRSANRLEFSLQATGATELLFEGTLPDLRCSLPDGSALPHTLIIQDTRSLLRFCAWDVVNLKILPP